ncbi:MAG: hypothetical protein Q4G47_00045 [Lachnospiraceae bacterium]|nr:hypothetical protein [Lachnospiraceae bacterium]
MRPVIKLGRLLHTLRRASLTVESAGVMAISFAACLTLISFLDVVRLQTNKSLELSNTARTMASAAGVAGDRLDDKWVDIPWFSQYELPFGFFGIGPVRIISRARVYPFIGSDEGVGGAEEGKNRDRMVYVSEHESVYHTHPDCTHIKITIIRTDRAGIGKLRNSSGGKYHPCSDIPSGYDGPIYVTPTGNYYYPSLNYSGLTRHVTVKKLSECRSQRLCSRCAARDGGAAQNAA